MRTDFHTSPLSLRARLSLYAIRAFCLTMMMWCRLPKSYIQQGKHREYGIWTFLASLFLSRPFIVLVTFFFLLLLFMEFHNSSAVLKREKREVWRARRVKNDEWKFLLLRFHPSAMCIEWEFNFPTQSFHCSHCSLARSNVAIECAAYNIYTQRDDVDFPWREK